MSERGCQCGQTHGACTTEFQYAVKLVCGVVAPTGGTPTPVAPGRYWTAINIHNPDKCKEAHFRWKVAVAAPGKAGPVSAYQRTLTLRPDEALEIDCPQVAQAFPPPAPTFVKGYVVIESDIELDVVAVYSGTQGGNTLLSSFHTERVQPRCVPVCEDLILSLHTGFTDWQTVAPTVGAVMPVGGTLPASWAVPPTGSLWVSQTSTDSQSATPGLRSYQLCFDLCFGYTPPAPFQIQVLADDTATVFLNNLPVGNVAGFATPTTLTVTPNLLRAGRNCWRIDLNNAGGPTAFALAGILRVIRGKCPCSPLRIEAKSPGPTPLEE